MFQQGTTTTTPTAVIVATPATVTKIRQPHNRRHHHRRIRTPAKNPHLSNCEICEACLHAHQRTAPEYGGHRRVVSSRRVEESRQNKNSKIHQRPLEDQSTTAASTSSCCSSSERQLSSFEEESSLAHRLKSIRTPSRKPLNLKLFPALTKDGTLIFYPQTWPNGTLGLTAGQQLDLHRHQHFQRHRQCYTIPQPHRRCYSSDTWSVSSQPTTINCCQRNHHIRSRTNYDWQEIFSLEKLANFLGCNGICSQLKKRYQPPSTTTTTTTCYCQQQRYHRHQPRCTCPTTARQCTCVQMNQLPSTRLECYM